MVWAILVLVVVSILAVALFIYAYHLETKRDIWKTVAEERLANWEAEKLETARLRGGLTKVMDERNESMKQRDGALEAVWKMADWLGNVEAASSPLEKRLPTEHSLVLEGAWDQHLGLSETLGKEFYANWLKEKSAVVKEESLAAAGH